MLKSFLLLLVSVLLFSCNYPGKGSLGGWTSITFPVQKDKFKLAVDSLRNANPQNEIPEKWQYDSEYWKRDAGGLKESEVLYIKKDPEEMYFFSYIPNDNDQNEKSTTIALRSVFRNGTWYRKVDLDTTQQKRISKRFNEDIIAELELITNTKSTSETEIYEQPEKADAHKKSDIILMIDSDKNIGIKRQLNSDEKSDSIATALIHGKFDISNIKTLEKICAKSEDLSMQSFPTTVEELFYSHMASFTDYYLANPGSCLKGKLKQSMEEYMAAYEPKDRMKKNAEKENRILKKAEREHFSQKQLNYLHELFSSINLK